MIERLKRLQRTLNESNGQFAGRFSTNRKTMAEILAGSRQFLPSHFPETYEAILDEFREQSSTDHPELLFPREIRPELKWIAMHSVSLSAYQWSAFESEEPPVFEPETGLWTIKKTDASFQVNITNMLVIPYDSYGPGRALFHRPSGDWERFPIEAPPVPKENRDSNPPDDLTKLAAFPRTTLRGPAFSSLERERNRR